MATGTATLRDGRMQVPRPLRIAVAVTLLVIAATLVLAIFFQPDASGREPFPTAPVTAERLLAVTDERGGVVEVRDAATGAFIASFGTGEGSFFRGIMRSFTFERRKQGIGRDRPFRLAAHDNGQVTLTDTATGNWLALSAFGPDNKAVFAAFLANRGDAQ